jgi:DNA-binding LacI/PurR family transcriptional regulator
MLPGQSLPPEARLSELLGVSRNTLRQALGQLEQEGVVERVQGRGTFFTSEQQRQTRSHLAALAFVSPQLREGPYPSLIEGFQQACAESHLQATVALTSNDIGRQADSLMQLVDQRIGGVAIVPTTLPPTPPYHLALLQQNHIPVVCCHRRVEGVKTPSVVFRGYEVGHLAASEFLAMGHRRFAMVFPHRYSMMNEYERGFRAAVEAHPDSADCHIDLQLYGASMTAPDPEATAAIRSRLTQLFKRQERATAIFCGNLSDAEQVYLEAAELGLSVPRDLSLVYFGSVWRESPLAQRMTCVGVDEHAIGRRAAQLLQEMRSGSRPLDDEEEVVFPIQLCQGETLAPPPD